MVSSSDSDEPASPKRRKRAPMFYKKYDGGEVPRTTRIRLEKGEKSHEENNQTSQNANQVAADIGNPESECLSPQSEENAFIENTDVIEGRNRDQETESEYGNLPNLENGSSFSSEDLSSSNSDGDEDEDERPFIKLGNFEFLNKKYHLNEPLLPVATVVETTKFETLLLVLSFSMQEGISYVGIGSLLRLINQVFRKEVIPDSIKVFRSLFDCDLGMLHHFYCPKCKYYIGCYSTLKKQGILDFECLVCKRKGTLKTMNNGNYFISIPLESQLKVYLETKKNIRELLSYRFTREKSDDTVRDVFDGELYKKLSAQGEVLSDPNNVSVTLNTDGSPVFQSGTNTMWPIQCRVNELPPKDRFASDNMFVCGVWFGKQEPDMNLFLTPFVQESCRLYLNGFQWKLDEEVINTRVVVLNACFDSKAKPEVQGHKQLHSYDGCSYCYHPGNLVNLKRNKIVAAADSSTSSEEDLTDDDGESETEAGQKKKKRETKAVRYCVSTGGYFAERKDQEIRDDMEMSFEDGQYHRGIRRKSVMSMVPQFDLAQGYVIDYMHCNLIGVGKTMLNLWLDKKFSKEPFSISSKIHEIDSRLLKITPPRNVSRRPKSIGEYAHYKANEFRMWIFFYSLPCLKGILPEPYFQHFSLLVVALTIFCSGCITNEDFHKASAYIEVFVSDFERLYGPSQMVHNVHITSHIPLIVKSNGPLWCFSAFSFENGNGVLINLVKGTVGVMSQIAQKYMNYRCVPLIVQTFLVSENVFKYCESLIPKRMCKNSVNYDNIRILGPGGFSPLSRQQREVLQRANFPCNEFCYFRFIKNSTVYHSSNYPKQGKKSYDSAVILSNNSYAVIERIFVHEHKMYLIVRKIIVQQNTSISNHVVGAKCSHVKECALYPFGSLEVVRAKATLGKCVFMRLGRVNYVCDIPVIFEKD